LITGRTRRVAGSSLSFLPLSWTNLPDLEISAHGWQNPSMKTQRKRHGVSRTQTLAVVLTLLPILLLGCGDDGSVPSYTTRFGQVGEVTVFLEVPLRFKQAEGVLLQVLTWNSSGVWQIRESISYRTLPGDENLDREKGGPDEYAYLIVQLHEKPLDLFEEVVPEVPGGCRSGETRVSLTIRDESRNADTTWVRCSQGTLATLSTAEAGPDSEAVRVIQAAILLRDFTVGRNFLSAYRGSVPFGTLDRAEDSGALLEAPRTFMSRAEGILETPEGWVQFWRDHTKDPLAKPPIVDWANEMVLVAAVGERSEAGDSIEVRRVLQTGDGTEVPVFERIPGDFCSPAAKDHYPVHIVVSPRTLLPIRFSDPTPERVPCGL